MKTFKLIETGWLVSSCILHVFLNNKFFAVNSRKHFFLTLLIIGIVSIPIWMTYGFIFFLVFPILAIWYASICYSEYELLEYKSLVHLK